MKIVLSGNKEPYQLTEKVAHLTIELTDGKNDQNLDCMIIRYDPFTLFLSPNNFYQISEAIKGRSALDVSFALSRGLPEYPKFSNSFLSKTETETALFKSLFLIYYWVEIAFTDVYAISLGPKIYNEFILDYNSLRSNQPDIYFLKKERIVNANQSSIDRLVELNLLVEAKFGSDAVGDWKSYFIPLLKPGVSRSFFSHPTDPTGNNTYAFWKQVLDDRDFRLQSWAKNRF
jgi:hypothetical protein